MAGRKSAFAGDAWKFWLSGLQSGGLPLTGTTPGLTVSCSVLLNNEPWGGPFTPDYDVNLHRWGLRLQLPGPGSVAVRWLIVYGLLEKTFEQSLFVESRKPPVTVEGQSNLDWDVGPQGPVGPMGPAGQLLVLRADGSPLFPATTLEFDPAGFSLSEVVPGYGRVAIIPNSSVQKVTLRKNSGSDVGSRKRINLIEGSNITLTAVDDGADDEIDVTIAALVVPSGLVLIGTPLTFSGATSASRDNCFSATYRNYLLVLNLDKTTTANVATLQLRAGGTPAVATDYHYNFVWMVSTAATVNGANSAATDGFRAATSSGRVGLGVMTISNPFLAKRTVFEARAPAVGATDFAYEFNMGGHELETSYDGLTLIPNSGTLTGELRVYGIQNA